MSKLSLPVTQLPHHRLLCLLAGNRERELDSFLSIPTEVTFPPDHTARLGHGDQDLLESSYMSVITPVSRVLTGLEPWSTTGVDRTGGRAVRSQHLELPDKEAQFF